MALFGSTVVIQGNTAVFLLLDVGVVYLHRRPLLLGSLLLLLLLRRRLLLF